MSWKIKVKPQDFIVEELASLPLVKAAGFGVYLLRKQGWNTVDLLHELSRRLRIPIARFSYGGRKDRYGLTSQYITIKGRKDLTLEDKNYSLTYIGSMEQPMAPDLIQANKFEIKVRNLTKDQANKAGLEIEEVELRGFANYFDDQRFGSYDTRQGFFAQKLLRQEFNGALKIYLTASYPGDKKEEKKRRRLFFENWRDWSACRKLAKTRFEIEAFSYLMQRPNGFLELLRKLPHHELSAYFATYQSFLWNEVLRRLIRRLRPGPLRAFKGVVGEYLFYTHLDEKSCAYFKELFIPVCGPGPKFADALVKSLYLEVLEGDGIKGPMFNKLKLRQAYFKSFARKASVRPYELRFEISNDEVYPGKKKLELKFCLARGSFATMFIKRIFSNG